MSPYLDCGCYMHPDGRLTRRPRHDANVELFLGLEDL